MLAVVLSNLLVLVTYVYRTFRGANGAGETSGGGSADETDSSSSNSTSKRETDVGTEGEYTPHCATSVQNHADEMYASIVSSSRRIYDGHENHVVSRPADQHLLEHISALCFAAIALFQHFWKKCRSCCLYTLCRLER